MLFTHLPHRAGWRINEKSARSVPSGVQVLNRSLVNIFLLPTLSQSVPFGNQFVHCNNNIPFTKGFVSLSKKLLAYHSSDLLPTVLAECWSITPLACGSGSPRSIKSSKLSPPWWPCEVDTTWVCTFHLRNKSLFQATVGFQMCFQDS